ncbi:MAG: hypothetical protein AABX59_02320 [Nanoarchaeota archaeon]
MSSAEEIPPDRNLGVLATQSCQIIRRYMFSGGLNGNAVALEQLALLVESELGLSGGEIKELGNASYLRVALGNAYGGRVNTATGFEGQTRSLCEDLRHLHEIPRDSERVAKLVRICHELASYVRSNPPAHWH